MCSPDDEALEMVKKFAETSLGFCIKKVPFEQYSAIAGHQNKVACGQEWVDAIWTIIPLFIFTQIYTIFRYVVHRLLTGSSALLFGFIILSNTNCVDSS
jgi:hypothetical protein